MLARPKGADFGSGAVAVSMGYRTGRPTLRRFCSESVPAC